MRTRDMISDSDLVTLNNKIDALIDKLDRDTLSNNPLRRNNGISYIAISKFRVAISEARGENNSPKTNDRFNQVVEILSALNILRAELSGNQSNIDTINEIITSELLKQKEASWKHGDNVEKNIRKGIEELQFENMAKNAEERVFQEKWGVIIDSDAFPLWNKLSDSLGKALAKVYSHGDNEDILSKIISLPIAADFLQQTSSLKIKSILEERFKNKSDFLKWRHDILCELKIWKIENIMKLFLDELKKTLSASTTIDDQRLDDICTEYAVICFHIKEISNLIELSLRDDNYHTFIERMVDSNHKYRDMASIQTHAGKYIKDRKKELKDEYKILGKPEQNHTSQITKRYTHLLPPKPEWIDLLLEAGTVEDAIAAHESFRASINVKSRNNVGAQYLNNLSQQLDQCTAEELESITLHTKLLLLGDKHQKLTKTQKDTCHFLSYIPDMAAYTYCKKINNDIYHHDIIRDFNLWTTQSADNEYTSFVEIQSDIKVKTLDKICSEYRCYLEQTIFEDSSFSKLDKPLSLFKSTRQAEIHTILGDTSSNTQSKLSLPCQLAWEKYLAVEKMEKDLAGNDLPSVKLERFNTTFKSFKPTIEKRRDTGTTTFLKIVGSILLAVIATPLSAVGIHSLFFKPEGKVVSEMIERELATPIKHTKFDVILYK